MCADNRQLRSGRGKGGRVQKQLGGSCLVGEGEREKILAGNV